MKEKPLDSMLAFHILFPKRLDEQDRKDLKTAKKWLKKQKVKNYLSI